MTPIDHVREAETLLAAATEAQPTDEAALLVARAQVHATLAGVIASEQMHNSLATAIGTAAASRSVG